MDLEEMEEAVLLEVGMVEGVVVMVVEVAKVMMEVEGEGEKEATEVVVVENLKVVVEVENLKLAVEDPMAMEEKQIGCLTSSPMLD